MALRLAQQELAAIRRDPIGPKLLDAMRRFGIDPLADKTSV